jgi:peptidyl-prolyl cis-trans isomerase C/foldase protein PrsA
MLARGGFISRFLIGAVVLVGFVAMGCRSFGNRSQNVVATPVDNSPVVLEINGSKENLSSFERFVKARLSDFYPQTLQNQSDGDKLRSGLFDEFVLRQLIVFEARKRGLSATEEEIGRAIAEQHQQTTLEGTDESVTSLPSSERRIEIANDLLTMKYYQSTVLTGLRVSGDEIEAYYHEHEAKYQERNGFYVREVRVSSAEEASRIEQQALRKPDDFATLVRQHSTAPNAVNGGLIYYATQQLPAVLEDAITPLRVGSISKVVRSNYGFHIFKLEARAEPLPLEKVRQQIEEDLLRTKNQKLIDSYNERALAEAQIKVYHDRLGFHYQGRLNQPKSES